jgi:hypothetical protein
MNETPYSADEAGSVGQNLCHCVCLFQCRLFTHQFLSTELRLHEKTIRKKRNYCCTLENAATQRSIRP